MVSVGCLGRSAIGAAFVALALDFQHHEQLVDLTIGGVKYIKYHKILSTTAWQFGIQPMKCMVGPGIPRLSKGCPQVAEPPRCRSSKREAPRPEPGASLARSPRTRGALGGFGGWRPSFSKGGDSET